LSVEQNLQIENKLRAKVHSIEGITMFIPYIYTNRVSLPVFSSQLVSLKYNNSHGKRFKKIWYALFNTIKQVNTSFDHSNLMAAGVARDKIQNFYIQMNSIYL
jgi:hypothetical protein